MVSLKTWSIVLHAVHAAKVDSKMNAQYCFFVNLIRGFLLQQVLQKHLKNDFSLNFSGLLALFLMLCHEEAVNHVRIY